MIPNRVHWFCSHCYLLIFKVLKFCFVFCTAPIGLCLIGIFWKLHIPSLVYKTAVWNWTNHWNKCCDDVRSSYILIWMYPFECLVHFRKKVKSAVRVNLSTCMQKIPRVSCKTIATDCLPPPLLLMASGSGGEGKPRWQQLKRALMCTFLFSYIHCYTLVWQSLFPIFLHAYCFLHVFSKC